jgi:hypothetical protein
MRDLNPGLDAALVGDDPIPREKVLWISAASESANPIEAVRPTGKH